MSTSSWNDLALVAPAQHGLVTREQLVDMGISSAMIDNWVRRDRLETVHSGVLRVAGSARSWEQEVHAAVLACGDEAGASHQTAAALWGMLDRPDVIDVSVPRRRGRSPRSVTVHRLTDFEPEVIGQANSIPTVYPLRTLAHLGATVPWWLVERALEAGLVKRLYTYEGVEWMRHDLSRKGRHGIGILGQVLEQRALAAGRPDSVLEPRMATLCRDHGLDMPHFQYEVTVNGRRFRIDFAYPHVKIAIEVDGFDPHGRREVWERDIHREALLTDAGWLVIRVTFTDIVKHPGRTAARIRRHLGERTAENGHQPRRSTGQVSTTSASGSGASGCTADTKWRRSW